MSTKLMKTGISTIKAGITGSPLDLVSSGVDFMDWVLTQTVDANWKAARDEFFREDIPLETQETAKRIEAMVTRLYRACLIFRGEDRADLREAVVPQI